MLYTCRSDCFRCLFEFVSPCSYNHPQRDTYRPLCKLKMMAREMSGNVLKQVFPFTKQAASLPKERLKNNLKAYVTS